MTTSMKANSSFSHDMTTGCALGAESYKTMSLRFSYGNCTNHRDANMAGVHNGIVEDQEDGWIIQIGNSAEVNVDAPWQTTHRVHFPRYMLSDVYLTLSEQNPSRKGVGRASLRKIVTAFNNEFLDPVCLKEMVSFEPIQKAYSRAREGHIHLFRVKVFYQDNWMGYTRRTDTMVSRIRSCLRMVSRRLVADPHVVEPLGGISCLYYTKFSTMEEIRRGSTTQYFEDYLTYRMAEDTRAPVAAT
jgi:hypothetical protein